MPIRIAWSQTIPFLGLNKLDAHSWVVWIRLKPRVNVYSHVWEESCSFGQEFGQAWFLGQEHIDKMVYMHTCLHFKPHSYLMLFIWNWHYSISKTSTTSCGIRFISEKFYHQNCRLIYFGRHCGTRHAQPASGTVAFGFFPQRAARNRPALGQSLSPHFGEWTFTNQLFLGT